jgi:hypothetical protein
MLGVRAVRLRFPFPGRHRDFCSHADRGFMILPLVARQVNPQGKNRSRKTLPTPPRSRELDIPLSPLANFEVGARVSSHERYCRDAGTKLARSIGTRCRVNVRLRGVCDPVYLERIEVQ